MTTLSSQYQTASSTANNVIPDRDPWWFRLSTRVFGHNNSITPAASSFPAITDGLAARILRVHESVAHAKTQPSLPYADLLITWDDAYNKPLKELLKAKKSHCHGQDALRRHSENEALLDAKPTTIEDCKKQLALQFSLFAGCSGPRFFAVRNQLADLYDHKAEKAGLHPHP